MITTTANRTNQSSAGSQQRSFVVLKIQNNDLSAAQREASKFDKSHCCSQRFDFEGIKVTE